MSDMLDDDIEIIYWGEEDNEHNVNAARFQKPKSGRKSNKQTDNWKKQVINWLKLVLIAVIIALGINRFILINATVPTGSMENTIHAKSRMMGFRLSYLFDDPERGDIIIFKYPDDETEKYVKRVIGLPGEYVEVRDGVVYINDKPLDEDYKYFSNNIVKKNGDFPRTYIPADSYFVLGDNRNDSNDSRFWSKTHFVKEEKIIGKALFSYFPKQYWLE